MSPRDQERGMVYLLVLVTAGVTVSMGMLAVFAAAAQREVQELSIERERAALRAEAGIQVGLAAIGSNDAWRSAAGGRVVATQTMDRGELTVAATDADGALDDEETDPFTLTATATYGRAKQRVAADVEVVYTPIEALEYAIVAQGGLTNVGDLSVSFADVSLDVSLVLLGALNPWKGDKGMDEIEMPKPSVIETYAARGTVLPVELSSDAEGMLYEDLILTVADAQSKESRGTADPNAIYVIDGRDGPVRLTDPRIVGTLVVVNASSLELATVRTLRPAGVGLPVLLTDAPLTFDGARSSETDTLIPDTDDDPDGPDFDPDTFDGVQGIIYADSDVSIFNGFDMHGTLMITGSLTTSGETNITWNDAFLEVPPPEFRSGRTWRIVAGTWRAVVD